VDVRHGEFSIILTQQKSGWRGGHIGSSPTRHGTEGSQYSPE